MPRGGWLAIGSVAAAAVGAVLSPRLALVLAIGTLAAAVLAAARGAGYGRAGADGRLRAAAPLALGALAIAVRLTVGGTSVPAGSASLPAGSGPWPASVEAVGTPRDGQQQVTLRLETGTGPRVAATLPRYPVVEPGDRILVSGSLRLPRDDGYGAYLARIGVVATLRASGLETLPAPPGPARWLESFRRASGDGLTRVLPEPEAGLAAGILVGLRDRVDRDLAAAFTTAGVSHVVAISGWNIAIVGATVAAIARRLSRRRRAVLTIAAIVGYTAFAGASPSVLRAAAMAAVVLLARESGRAGTAAAALGWAATLLLLVDPHLVTDAGFQLSTLATAGLIAWATPFTRRLKRVAGGRLPGWLAEGLGVSLAAQAATLPVILLAFGRLALVSPIVNLAVVPLVPPAMAAGAVALVAGWLALGGIPGTVTTLLGLPAWFLLTVMARIVEASASLPGASVTLEPPLAGLGAATACTLAGAVVMRHRLLGRLRRLRRLDGFGGLGRLAPGFPALGATRRHKPRTRPIARCPHRPLGRAGRALAIALSAAILGLILAAANRPDGRAHLTVLDVGQGDAILVESGGGGRLLVDGGPDPDRLLVALDGRLPPWDRRLDLLVLTHPHEDHAAGLPMLLGRYRIGRIFEPGMRGPGPGYQALASGLASTGRHIERLATGDRLTLDDIRFRVMWPDAARVPRLPPDSGTGINNVSIVLLGEVTGRRFLLTGDIEEGIDPVLVARGLPRVDVLKVAHHGSRTASTDAFLDATRPRVAVISVGAGNTYGHPSRVTLGRLAAHGARAFRTDQNGSTEITFDGPRLLVQPEIDASPAATAATATLDAGAGPAIRFGCPIAGPRTDGGRTDAGRPADVTAALLYHRADVRAGADRSRRPPPLPRPAAVVPQSLACGGRDRRLARAARRGGGDADRSTDGRVSRTAARCRQAPPGRRSGAGSPPRRRFGGLAGATRLPRARAPGRGTPGDEAARRSWLSALVGIGEPRGADRRLCRQASRAAARVDGRAVRLVATPLSPCPRRVRGGRLGP